MSKPRFMTDATPETYYERFIAAQEQLEYYTKLYAHEVHLYGSEIVNWSLIQGLEKIKRLLQEKRDADNDRID